MTDTITLQFVDVDDDANHWYETTWVGAIPDARDTVLYGGGEYMVVYREWSFTQTGSPNAVRGRWAPIIRVYVHNITARGEGSAQVVTGEAGDDDT